MIYPTEADGSIPTFGNREEEAEWFDTHDLTAIWNEGTPVKPEGIESQSMQLLLDPESDAELQQFANEHGVKKATLARMWLEQRIHQERERRAS